MLNELRDFVDECKRWVIEPAKERHDKEREIGGCRVTKMEEEPESTVAKDNEATEAPQKKKRKPTAKQLEEAEAAARPRYDPNTDRPPAYSGPACRIFSWNVTSLNATLRNYRAR